MSQLTQIRQRIKTVETIKKITHAMRLISMSSRTRLKHKKEQLETYKKHFYNFVEIINSAIKEQTDPEQDQLFQKTLLILISSQKGLCGSFNTNLFKLLSNDIKDLKDFHVITVGKYATDFIKSNYKQTPIAEYSNINGENFTKTAQAITDIIITTKYQNVICYSNYSKNFFTQKPESSIVYPINNIDSKETPNFDEYIWQESPEELLTLVQKLTILTTIQLLIFESLLSEQSARFISMDNATRNAENLIIDMKIAYNKIRQAAITKELTELAGSL